MVSESNFVLAHFVISFNYFIKERRLQSTACSDAFQTQGVSKRLCLFLFVFAMSWTHRTIYRKVTVQTGCVGAGQSSCCLSRQTEEQINTCCIMHACAGVKLRLPGWGVNPMYQCGFDIFSCGIAPFGNSNVTLTRTHQCCVNNHSGQH